MEQFTITEEMLAKAKDYLPLAKKAEICAYIAERCFDKMEISTLVNGAVTAMPPLYKENTAVKARYMLGLLLGQYFGVEFDPIEGDKYLMAQDDYDRWAANHPLNRIERMKSCASLKDKCFDLLQDYKALEKMVNAEVYGVAQAYNDIVGRAAAAIGNTLSQMVTPEKLQELEKAEADLKDYIAKREQAQKKGGEAE